MQSKRMSDCSGKDYSPPWCFTPTAVVQDWLPTTLHGSHLVVKYGVQTQLCCLLCDLM